MYQFPSITVSEKEKKTEAYHMKWAQSLVNSTFTGNWALNYNKMKMLYSFFLDGTGNDLTNYLQSAPDGSAMPGIWTSQNSVRTRIRSLIGEFEERSYLIKARALNTEAQERKREEHERLRIKRKLQTLRQAVQDESGIPLESPEYVPQSDDELKEYMDLTWKDKNVLILEGACKWLALRNEDAETRKRQLLEQFIVNISPVRVEIVDGLPIARGVDPMKFGMDPFITDDIGGNAGYFYEAEYKPLADIAARYGLTEEDLQKSCTLYNNGLGVGATGDPGWGCMNGQVVKWFTGDEGVQRALVLKLVWKDYKTLAHKHEVKEEYGSEFFQDVTYDEPRERDKGKIVYNKLECWRQATLIGGQFLREYGECPNQPRELSSLQKAYPPYVVWTNEMFNGKWTSMVEQLVGLQMLKDIALYQLQVQMARAVGKVLVFDEAMMPENQTRETTLRYIKSDGIVFVNSKEYQQQTGTLNLFKDYDIGLSQTVQQAIEIVAYLDKQIDATSGVTPERQGQIQGSSVSTGTTQAALIQNSMVTAPFFKGFERHWSRVQQMVAKLVKIAWAGKEKFAPIIGDVGINFLQDNIDISLDEFDVVVQSMPPSIVDRQTLNQWLTFAVQADPTFLADAMAIMMEPDTTVAVREFQRKDRIRKRQMAQQAQAQQQAEAEAQKAQQAHEQQLAQGEIQGAQQLQSEKEQSGLQRDLAKGRVKLSAEKIKLYQH